MLITSDQHYGAVINLDFDFIPFLDRLHEYGMNLTRIYPGGYVEVKDQYTKGNPLEPAPDRYILPWGKTTVTGANPNLVNRSSLPLSWFSDTVTMDVPQGRYRAEWINPSSGKMIYSEDYTCGGAQLILLTPKYLTDIALRMRSIY